MRKFLETILFNPILWLIFGGVLLLLGAAVAGDIPAITAHVRQIEQLPSVDDTSQAAIVAFEGRISRQTPTIYGEFVSYLREAYQSCGRSSCWVETTRETPPLQVASGDLLVQIVNDDYRFETTAHTVEEAQPTLTTGTIRSRGFRPDSQVFGIGEVVERAGKPQVRAEFLWAGTQADYMTHLQAYRRRSLWWGGGFLTSGLLLSIVGTWQGWQFLRSVQRVTTVGG